MLEVLLVALGFFDGPFGGEIPDPPPIPATPSGNTGQRRRRFAAVLALALRNGVRG